MEIKRKTDEMVGISKAREVRMAASTSGLGFTRKRLDIPANESFLERKCKVCGTAKKLHRQVGKFLFCVDHKAEAFAAAVDVRRTSYSRGRFSIDGTDGPSSLEQSRRADGMIPDCCPMFENVPPEDGWEEPTV